MVNRRMHIGDFHDGPGVLRDLMVRLMVRLVGIMAGGWALASLYYDLMTSRFTGGKALRDNTGVPWPLETQRTQSMGI